MYKLGEKITDSCGNKAKFLSILKSKGYNIPMGVVIEFEEFKQILKDQELNFEDIDKIVIPDALIDKIYEMIPQGKMYAIRSSANVEDCRDISLAGRYTTFLNVVLDRECFKERIKSCFLSLYSLENLEFYRKNKIDINNIKMNVIIQEMIESNVSGVLFTVNPVNGADTQIVIEFSKGSGDVVAGKVVPERLIYDWMSETYLEEPKMNLLGDNTIRSIINISLNLQQELGFPIDVEFGVYDSKLYIFQVRPVTKIEHKEVYSRFASTSKSLTTFMYSLEEKISQSTTQSLFNELKIVSETELSKPMVMNKFSRVYWNLSTLKRALENIPGYTERNLDEELQVDINYLDNGKQKVGNNKKILSVIPRKNIMDLIKKQNVNVDEIIEGKIKEVNRLISNMNNPHSDIADKIQNVLDTINLYYDVKSAHAWQRYLNLMYRTNLNDYLDSVLNKNEINNLLLGINNDCKNGAYKHMWNSSREIRNNPEKLKFFEENLDAEIYYLFRKEKENENIKGFLTDFLNKYGYHSFDESDVINKTYDEEVLKVIKTFRDVLELDDKYDPEREQKQQLRLYEQSIEKIESSMKKGQSKPIIKNIEFIRNAIEKTNELEDLVVICQSILRKHLLILGEEYKNMYFIDNPEDIFFIEYKYIINGISESMKNMVAKNRLYYNSFRNYNAQRDILPCPKQYIEMDNRELLQATGASFGKVDSRACVVNNKEDLKILKSTDILVTKYLDKEIFGSYDISKLAGIVTEFGGILCHLAINARENNIPCVVGLKEATVTIQPTEPISMDGDLGQVKRA